MARKALIQLRRDTSTNWTSVNPTLASGEIGYETDFNRFKVGDGTTPWNTLTYTSAGGMGVGVNPPASPTAGTPWFNTNDGTLYVYYTDANSSQWVQVKANSALEASILSRLSSLETQAIAYGQLSPNYVINGGFDIWQRGTSFTSSTTGFLYHADRWRTYAQSGASATISRQTFTPGTAPVAGYEGSYFVRVVDTNNSTTLYQPIEDVRTLAGQRVTVSFWAKTTSTTVLNIGLIQNFGSGGSAAVGTSGTSMNLTSSWARYTTSITLPSISGKTIGTSSYLELQLFTPVGTANITIDVWGVQLEAGSTATAFRRNQPNIQAELAACQRYFYRWTGNSGESLANVNFWVTDRAWGVVALPVTMRTTPSINFGGSGWHVLAANANISLSNIGASNSTPNSIGIDAYTTGGAGTQNLGGTVRVNVNSGTSYVQATAEL